MQKHVIAAQGKAYRRVRLEHLCTDSEGSIVVDQASSVEIALLTRKQELQAAALTCSMVATGKGDASAGAPYVMNASSESLVAFSPPGPLYAATRTK